MPCRGAFCFAGKELALTSKLYVGNLDYRTTSGDLTQLFAGAGQVLSAHVIEDRDTGQSKGFAFVEMASDAEALKAIGLYNGHMLNERAMSVGEARERGAAPQHGNGGRGNALDNRHQFRLVKHKSRGGANRRRF
jgi:RNA recognition motif-containing protein